MTFALKALKTKTNHNRIRRHFVIHIFATICPQEGDEGMRSHDAITVTGFSTKINVSKND